MVATQCAFYRILGKSHIYSSGVTKNFVRGSGVSALTAIYRSNTSSPAYGTLQTMSQFRRALLRTPLVNKILVANLAIVAAGAVGGTVFTVWHVQTYPDDVHYVLIAVFAAIGILVSFLVNKWVLARALDPLDRLQQAVDAVRSGAPGVRVQLGEISDERFDRLADTFNQMLAQLEQDAQEMQQLSRQILQAQEDERYRLARELHDEAAQALTSLLVHLRLLERARDPESAQQQVKELRVLTASALENVRRVALDLRPTILDDLGLASALEWRVDEFNKMEGMNAQISISGLDHRLPRDLELVLYRIGQEALSNVGRHAHATHVELLLARTPREVKLEVRDDGAGFDPMTIGGRDRGLGLLGMRERIGMVDGELLVESQVGKGTRVVATAPAP